MNVSELITQIAFSASGKDVRLFYTLVSLKKVVEYIGVSNALNAPTSAKVWYITKVEYDSDPCVVRVRSLSTQEVLDNKASFFP